MERPAKSSWGTGSFVSRPLHLRLAQAVTFLHYSLRNATSFRKCFAISGECAPTRRSVPRERSAKSSWGTGSFVFRPLHLRLAPPRRQAVTFPHYFLRKGISGECAPTRRSVPRERPAKSSWGTGSFVFRPLHLRLAQAVTFL